MKQKTEENDRKLAALSRFPLGFYSIAGASVMDGLDVLAGQQGLFWDGALRFVVGDDAAAACYDQNGNRVPSGCWRLRDGVAYEQVWDAENRLASATNHATGETTAFTYDGDGALVRKVVGSLTTLYVGNYYEKQGSTILKYYYFAGQRVAMRKEGMVYYLVGDHLGTTSVVLDASGGLVGESRHLPYGDERWASGAVPTEYRFTGQRLDRGRFFAL